MQASAGGVEGELADRNAHPARALVAQAENALAIGDHDGFDTVETRIRKNAAHAFHVRHAEKKTAWLAEALAELLTSQPYGGRVDDRQHFRQVTCQDGIEQDLVAVLEAAQEDVAGKIARELPERLDAAVDLLVQTGDIGRQQAMQIERIPFLLGERRSFVQKRIIQQLVAEQARFDVGLPSRALSGAWHSRRPLNFGALARTAAPRT